ncbi:MAG: hypothetical protein ACJAVK_001530 [Akkermansiaceae bacterium]
MAPIARTLPEYRGKFNSFNSSNIRFLDLRSPLSYLFSMNSWISAIFGGVMKPGVNDEWIFRFNFDLARVTELPVFRGLVPEVRESGETFEEIIYPHIYGDSLIESPTKFRKRE